MFLSCSQHCSFFFNLLLSLSPGIRRYSTSHLRSSGTYTHIRLRSTSNLQNPRLLSQFVSNYTGLLYERNITGLCARQQEAVKYHIKVAHFLNLMPRFYKDPHYTNDPKLFNPFKPIRENNV